MRKPLSACFMLCMTALLMSSCAVTGQETRTASATTQEKATRTPDVIYVPTPQPVVKEMLRVTNVKAGDVVYDLGCGDGRIVITAAKDHGARGIGVDIDPRRIRESRENARKAGVQDKVKFVTADLFEMNFKDATVVTLYLLPSLNVKLRPKLFNDLRPGTRVVSHDFDMDDWEPDKHLEVAMGDGATKDVYYWVIPARLEGRWTWTSTANGAESGALTLQRRYQKVTGTLTQGSVERPIRDGRINGNSLSFTLGDGDQATRYTATLREGRLVGTAKREGGAARQWTARRQ